MTGIQFTAWLAAMKAAGLSRSDAAASRLLGISPNSVVKLKQRGTDLRTALACRALIERLGPWVS